MEGTRHKIKSLQEIVAIATRARRKGRTVVTTNGCFDLLHVGHIRNLERAKSLGDILIVGVNSDRSARALKGPGRPIVPARERAEVLAALHAVDYVFTFHSATPIAWLKKVKPSTHVKGADRNLSKIVEKETVEKNGGKVVLVPYVKNKSTTNLAKKISSVMPDIRSRDTFEFPFLYRTPP